LDAQQPDEICEKIDEIYNKIESSFVKHVAHKHKFANYHLPIYNFSMGTDPEAPAQPGENQVPVPGQPESELNKH